MRDFDNIQEVVSLLKRSRSILFITGAGISADSGVPTYRGIGGLYHDRHTEEKIPIETALSGDMLRTRPEITWKYLAEIERGCRNARFNRGHEVIAEMERHFERVWVLTQNVDGFHFQAGSRNVIDIHGDIHGISCLYCSWKTTVGDFSNLAMPPVCPQCQAPARPDVVLFGEMLYEDKVELMMKELERPFDLYFSVGTTSVFPYIQQPMILAARSGIPTVEINPQRTEISPQVSIRMEAGAAEALGRIWQAYQEAKDGRL